MTMRSRSLVQEARLVILVAWVSSICACATLRSYTHRVSEKPPQRASIEAEAEPEPAAWRGGWTWYRVQRGDTLGRIAACRGISTRELAKANGIGDPRRLRVGQRLKVPHRDRCRTQRAEAAPPPQGVTATPGGARPAVDADVERSQRLLADARTRYDAADFEAALRGADEAGRALPPDRKTLRARCHLLAALAAAGLEDRPRAISELRAAFALDPNVVPDPEDRSPRIDELVAAARQPPANASSGGL
jgi:LysM repeat protein